MTAAAKGIHIAMYGGENTEGNNYDLDAAMSLSRLDFNDMETAAQGIAVLRTSLTAVNPTQALKAASSSMNASTGGVTTVVNANNNSTNNTASQSNTYSEMSIDHDESSGSIFSKVIDFVF